MLEYVNNYVQPFETSTWVCVNYYVKPFKVFMYVYVYVHNYLTPCETCKS